MIEKRTRPYEVLVRIQPDGSQAAHVREIEEVIEDGVVIAAKELDARPLALAGDEFGALVQSIDRGAQEEIMRLRAQLAGAGVEQGAGGRNG